MMSNRFFVK